LPSKKAEGVQNVIGPRSTLEKNGNGAKLKDG
jgi:hypothetical protein